MKTTPIKNVAIIAHVDHGKTSLVDCLLRQSNTLSSKEAREERIMDSNQIEKERGITILAKITAINYKNHRINIVDTPGHADFSGEVERVLNMVEGVLLVVCAFEGPKPQTRYVLKKALEKKLKPIVVINKVDRPGVDIQRVENQIYDLFIDLGADEHELDFPFVYASAKSSFARLTADGQNDSTTVILDKLIDVIPSPADLSAKPLQLLVSMIGYDPFLGQMAIGKITQGSLSLNQPFALYEGERKITQARVVKLRRAVGVQNEEVPEVGCGDIAILLGQEPFSVGQTITDCDQPQNLPMLKVDEPTLSMYFMPNDSPFSGKEGQFVTSAHVKTRLNRELRSNVGLYVEEDPEQKEYFKVSGRGELHLSILIENMRREGYEFSVSKPEVVVKKVNGKTLEPFETCLIEVPEAKTGTIMELMPSRKATLKNMASFEGRTTLEFDIPTRGLIGLRSELLTETQGEAIVNHMFDRYDEFSGQIEYRHKGSLISSETGESMAFSLWKLQPRGILFIGPQTKVYEGMIVGEHTRDNDLVVNVCKNKQLTNVRASGSDEAMTLRPHQKMTLEEAIEFINDDELVEVTPKSIRLRKKFLTENERKRYSRQKNDME